MLRLTTQQNAVVVPNQAVQTGQNGAFVYVVKPDQHGGIAAGHDGRARGSGHGGRAKGSQAGETVVTEGQLRLAPGSRYVVPATAAEAAEAAAAGKRVRRRGRGAA